MNTGDIFSISHSLAMLLHCNNNILCNIFLQTFTESNNIETIDEFKKRHFEYANWTRLMREIGECFGDKLENNNNQSSESFYHSISSQ